MDKNHLLTPEEQKRQKEAFDAELDKEHAILFKKRELIAVFNMLVSLNMKYGDFLVFESVIKKIEPIVAVTSNIPQEEKPVLTGVKETN